MNYRLKFERVTGRDFFSSFYEDWNATICSGEVKDENGMSWAEDDSDNDDDDDNDNDDDEDDDDNDDAE